MGPTRTTRALAALVILGCAAPEAIGPRAPEAALSLQQFGPEGSGEELEAFDATGWGHSPQRQSASGHGNLTVGGELRTFSFTAVRHQDLSVSGEFELLSRATGARIHGTVTCFFAFARPLDPERGAAFLAGRVDQSENGPAPGTLVIFNAFDNGEGANALFPDFISLVLTGVSPLAVQRQCANGLAITPALPIEGGNIQVRP